MNDKEKADILRKAAEYIEGVDPKTDEDTYAIEQCISYADKLDPPYKVDRSLRGWVLMTEPCMGTWVWRAYEKGLADREETMTWGIVEKRGCKVEQLRTLQPDEVVLSRSWASIIRDTLSKEKYYVAAQAVEMAIKETQQRENASDE